MSDPVFEGLAEGLKPPADTVPTRDLALIAIGAKLDRLAEASERQADALEVLAALMASCVGVGSARCYGDGERFGHEVPLNYLRSGDGSKPFACDADKSSDDNGE
ncbi:hypothetical protein [Bradyrhizobium neotropicale]|uniref:Uncharacterized protein n=1 Tax=Bradyrhizobium neotropicale TaxID=1497615 RepID=A0A176Z3U3_9BRAD|nr:hypothetical protein [Bradyrhizobium neotropicale]OAF14113.1 hypothetical protein AXW67_00520 [Bradyrhizobium neotropicale]